MDSSYADETTFVTPRSQTLASRPWWKVGQLRDSDQEYVEKIRRSVNWWMRWRWLVLTFSVSLTAAIIWMGFQVDALIADFDDMFAGQQPGIVVSLGVILGIKVGLGLQGAIWGIFHSLSSFRTERLLLQRVDLQQPIQNSEDLSVQQWEPR